MQRSVWLGCFLSSLFYFSNAANGSETRRTEEWASAGRVSQAIREVYRTARVQNWALNPKNILMPMNSVFSETLETVQLQHYYNGIEVLGSTSFHHIKRKLSPQHGLKALEDWGVFSRFANPIAAIRHRFSRFDLSTKPTVSKQDARALITSYFGKKYFIPKNFKLKILPSQKSNQARLIYWISAQPNLHSRDRAESGVDILLDAHTGQLVASISHIWKMAPARPQDPPSEESPTQENPAGKKEVLYQVYDASDMSFRDIHPWTGAPLRINLSTYEKVIENEAVSSSADQSARQAHLNAKTAIQYFQENHSRLGFDGRGGAARSVVHVGRKFPNAFWDSSQNIMGYGDGDGREMGSLTRAVDVAGHEMTHGVISSTANLVYFGESGALNEAIADFFGKMIEFKATGDLKWIVGQNIFLDESRAQIGLRNLKDPSSIKTFWVDASGKARKRSYPSHRDEQFESFRYCGGHNDNCYVHANSTIPSRAMVELVDRIGMETAEKLIYLVLTQFLTRTSDFQDFRDSTLKACEMTLTEWECDNVSEAFSTVGITS